MCVSLNSGRVIAPPNRPVFEREERQAFCPSRSPGQIMTKKIAFILLSLASLSAPAPAQDVPWDMPLPGATGTIGLDGTVDKFYAATHSALVKAADGVRHLVHLTRRTAVHGTTPGTEDAFYGLEEGGRVVVHYVADSGTKTAVEIDRVGDGGLKVAEGVVVGIDRGARKLDLQRSDNSRVAFRLTERAAQDVGSDVAMKTKVVVYYAEEGGEQVVHYFKKVR
jgi:hypothetical protein